jgi:hypothetical protein
MVAQSISDWTISKVEARVRTVESLVFKPYLEGLDERGEMKDERVGELCYMGRPWTVARGHM